MQLSYLHHICEILCRIWHTGLCYGLSALALNLSQITLSHKACARYLGLIQYETQVLLFFFFISYGHMCWFWLGWYGAMFWIHAGHRIDKIEIFLLLLNRTYMEQRHFWFSYCWWGSWGCMGYWRETHPGQGTQTDQRGIPDHMTSCLAYKHGRKKEEA